MFRGELSVLAIALAVAGCNSVLGLDPTIAADAAPTTDAPPPEPDLDRDGILDVIDPCIATAGDATADSESDAQDNTTDDCPFDATLGPNADGDDIQDQCDPFPSLGGDRIRCVMAFGNPGLNARLWRQRPGETGWDFGEARLIGFGTGTIVATAEIDAAHSTSLDIYGSVSMNAGSQAFTVWLRTGLTASASDVGCRVSGDATSSELAIVHGGAPITMPLARGFGSAIRMRATLEPQALGMNVRCEIDYVAFNPLDAPALSARVEIPPSGKIGFAIENTTAGIAGLTIMERPSPGLP